MRNALLFAAQCVYDSWVQEARLPALREILVRLSIVNAECRCVRPGCGGRRARGGDGRLVGWSEGRLVSGSGGRFVGGSDGWSNRRCGWRGRGAGGRGKS